MSRLVSEDSVAPPFTNRSRDDPALGRGGRVHAHADATGGDGPCVERQPALVRDAQAISNASSQQGERTAGERRRPTKNAHAVRRSATFEDHVVCTGLVKDQDATAGIVVARDDLWIPVAGFVKGA